MALPRLQEAGAREIDVRALYDADRLAVLLEWKDAHRDADLGTVMQYRDAVAVQFPEDSAGEVPLFTMGMTGNGVVIYHWKSDWQFSRLHDVDEAYPNMYADWYPFSGVPAGEIPEATDYVTRGQKEYLTAVAAGNSLADPGIQERIGPIQKMRAEGFGTIEPHKTQDARGRGEWRDGVWRIAFSLPRRQERFTFGEGIPYKVSFAVWDGARNERNGQKAVAVWQTLGLGAIPDLKPDGGTANEALPVVGGVAGALAAVLTGLAALIGFRRRRENRSKQALGSEGPDEAFR
jgi:hypothetical protein